MMSKRLFCRAIKEDLRHKLWMIALSVLASFLAYPVVWLMAGEGIRSYAASMAAAGFTAEEQIRMVLATYTGNMIMTGGFVAGEGAVVVGLFSFRFLFHRSSVDTWHSLPVSRNRLYVIYYLDGFLIWFVPAMVCSMVSSAIVGGYLKEIGGMGVGLELLKRVFWTLFASGLLFLTIYHLILVAVMLSGNILNTLVSMLILGCGVMAAWGIGTGFFQIFLDTFYGRYWGLRAATYASPLLGGPMVTYMLYKQVNRQWSILEEPGTVRAVGINLAVMIILGVCAWLLYRRRESEHAEQGIRSRAAAALFRSVSCVGAAMCGWLLFSLLVEENKMVWGCFGAVLAGGMTFGILDIIFHMDFKAFFAHKLQMTGILVLSLFLCAAFQGDWFGYDTYLPGKEDIQSVGIYNYYYANRNFYSDSGDNPLECAKLQNMETVYPFLECVTEWQNDDDRVAETKNRWQQIDTKVTLKNGRSYYRSYVLPKEDREVLLALLTDEAYLSRAYLVKEDIRNDNSYKITLHREDSRYGNSITSEMLQSIIRAYNADLLENPEDVITGRGRLLAVLYVDSGLNDLSIDVYDFMERTVEALTLAGFEKWVSTVDPGNVSSLELGLYYGFGDGSESETAEELMLEARLTYGVYGDKSWEELEAEYRAAEDAYEERVYSENYDEDEYGEDIYIGSEYTETKTNDEYDREENPRILQITDPEEIEELLLLISYASPGRGTNLFQEEYVRIGLTDITGKTSAVYIEKGKLPEKYIYRFGNLKY